jgi:hypothetical protein
MPGDTLEKSSTIVNILNARPSPRESERKCIEQTSLGLEGGGI